MKIRFAIIIAIAKFIKDAECTILYHGGAEADWQATSRLGGFPPSDKKAWSAGQISITAYNFLLRLYPRHTKL